MQDLLNKALEIIKSSSNITAFSGAGISTGSGIRDFRGPEGLYSKGLEPEVVLSIDYFKKDPSHFWELKRPFLEQLRDSKPNKMHLFLSFLEENGKRVNVITQNIDSLHKKAGSKNVIELHGSFERSHCLNCKKEFSLSDIEEFLKRTDIPKCECGGFIKPDIVLFGEEVKNIRMALETALSSETMVIIGTSLAVAPASMLPYYFKGELIVINKGELYSFVNSDVFLNMDIIEVAEYFFKNYEKI